MAPSKSAKTWRPRACAGRRKRRRYTEMNWYALSSKLCQGSRLFVWGIVTCSKPESSKPATVAPSTCRALKRQLRLMGRSIRLLALLAPAGWPPRRACTWPFKASPASSVLLDLRKSRRLIMVSSGLPRCPMKTSETIQNAWVMYKKKLESLLANALVVDAVHLEQRLQNGSYPEVQFSFHANRVFPVILSEAPRPVRAPRH